MEIVERNKLITFSTELYIKNGYNPVVIIFLYLLSKKGLHPLLVMHLFYFYHELDQSTHQKDFNEIFIRNLCLFYFLYYIIKN